MLFRRECWSEGLRRLRGVLGVRSPVNCLWRRSLLQYSFRISVKWLKTFVSIYRSVIKLFTLSYLCFGHCFWYIHLWRLSYVCKLDLGAHMRCIWFLSEIGCDKNECFVDSHLHQATWAVKSPQVMFTDGRPSSLGEHTKNMKCMPILFQENLVACDRVF